MTTAYALLGHAVLRHDSTYTKAGPQWAMEFRHGDATKAYFGRLLVQLWGQTLLQLAKIENMVGLLAARHLIAVLAELLEISTTV